MDPTRPSPLRRPRTVSGTGLDGRNREFPAVPIGLVLLLGVFSGPEQPSAMAGDVPSPDAKGLSRQIYLDGHVDGEAMPCEVVQVLDAKGKPSGYFMDVDSVVCGDSECESVKVRLHFDPLGSYERYEIPSGGNLTKWGNKPFSRADHEKLHEILSNPYSPLKSVEWDQITVPTGPGESGDRVDGISRATALSKRNVVVVGAAYTTVTLWHWSHGEAVQAIRGMTVRANDKQDWIRYLQSRRDKYVEFAIDELLAQKRFDAEIADAVVQLMRHGGERLADPAFRYLEKASAETGVDCFFRYCDDDFLAASPGKRVQFLEAVRDTAQKPPPRYSDRFGGWLIRADSHYEVHLLLTMLEREDPPPGWTVGEAMTLLESDNSLVVRRACQFLKAQNLSPSQQRKLTEFEQHPQDG